LNVYNMMTSVDLIRHNKAPVLHEYIEAFEALIGARLPDDYRKFLLTTGGNVTPAKVAEVSCGRPGSVALTTGAHDVELEQLAGIVPDAYGASELSTRYRYMSGPERENNWLPDDLIVIGNSGGGGRCFVIGIKGERSGRVYFWDINLFPQDDNVPETYQNISFVAQSFDAFLGELKTASWEQ